MKHDLLSVGMDDVCNLFVIFFKDNNLDYELMYSVLDRSHPWLYTGGISKYQCDVYNVLHGLSCSKGDPAQQASFPLPTPKHLHVQLV